MHTFDSRIQSWISDGSIPGAVLDISIGSRFRFTKAYGGYSDNREVRSVGVGTLFDLASLTKVVATLPVALSLAAEGRLNPDQPVSQLVPEFKHSRVTIRHLLQHSSGLPADLPFVPRSEQGRKVLEEIWLAPLESEPGTRVLYSDLGMIVLGEALRRAGGQPLDVLARQRIFEPLGMSDTGYLPLISTSRERVAATEYVDGSYIVGSVHDEKCAHLGGVSGSAGLFGTAENLTRYMRAWIYPDQAVWTTRDYIEACFDRPIQGRGLGWEIRHLPDVVPASCGKLWSMGSFGHTGFTGTSMWADPQHELTVVWLTNAVYLGRQTPIRTLRSILHDDIITAIIQGNI